MMPYSLLPGRHLLALSVLLFFLAACRPAAGEGDAPTADLEPAGTLLPAPESPQAEAAGEEAQAVTPQSPPEEATETPTETPLMVDPDASEELGENGVTVLSGDTRSDRLRRLTESWDTDWTRHTIDYEEILSGGPPRDGIPSIDSPQFVSQEDAAAWLAGNEPVIALEIDGDARGYPLQIMTWHEIANDRVGGVPVVVTFCPLCNSALVFDRRLDGELYEFGTSGLLRHSDLIMYDRTTESLWQQFTGRGIVGELAGAQLRFLPVSLISFDDFREAFPAGTVLSRETGFNRRYGTNPYTGYDRIGQNPFLFRGETDERLPAMARVVTVSRGDVSVAYPYDTLAEAGVVHDEVAGQELVVFYNLGTSSALDTAQIAEGADVGATGVFDPNLDGQKLTFTAQAGAFVDEQTGSTWNLLGQATSGPLQGKQLTPLVHGNQFWFSWAAFKPDTVIFSG